MESGRINLLLLAGEVALAAGIAAFAHAHLDRQFFVVASEILPILLLAAIVDLRSSTVEASDRWSLLLLVGSFAIGEAVALAIVGNRHEEITKPLWLGIVVAALAGVTGLLLSAAFTKRQATPKPPANEYEA